MPTSKQSTPKKSAQTTRKPAAPLAPKKTAKPPTKPAARKPAAKRATGSDSGGAVAGGSAAPTHSWPELVSRAKPPSDTERTLYAVQLAPDLLRAEGKKIASDHILTDALRWSGTLVDFVTSAPPTLVKKVRGFSLGLLRVLVAEGARLFDLNQRFQSDKKARRDGARVDKQLATGSRTLAQNYRRQLVATLKTAAQKDGDILRRLATAQSPRELSVALHALVALTRELLGDKATPVSQRLSQGGVDAEYLTLVESQAAQAGETDTRVTGPKKSTPVSQAELDVQDGICLTLMDQLLMVFEAARAIDPQVPALIPIATRTYFRSHKTAAKAPSPPPTAPAPQ